jgi:Domain of unknown function (DUF1844)
LPNEKREKPDLKVTDKRIFTAEGDIRDEFREQIRPAEPGAQRVAAMPAAEKAAPPRPAEPPRPGPKSPGHRDGRTIADKATNPETPFSNFIEPLIAQTYMSLGMLRNPYQPQAKVDPVAARQMIEILTVLQEKTKGNLIEAEDDFLTTHLGELKLAYVQRTKNL